MGGQALERVHDEEVRQGLVLAAYQALVTRPLRCPSMPISLVGSAACTRVLILGSRDSEFSRWT